MAPRGSFREAKKQIARQRATPQDWAAHAEEIRRKTAGEAPAGAEVDLSFLNTMPAKQRRRLVNRAKKGVDTTTATVTKKGGKGGKPQGGKKPTEQELTWARMKALEDGMGRRTDLATRQRTTTKVSGFDGAAVANKANGKGADADDPWRGMNRWEELVAGRTKLDPHDLMILVSAAENNPYGKDIVMSQANFTAQFYAADKETVASWQDRLFAAGYYRPESKYYTRKDTADVKRGELDYDTRTAFADMLDDAALRNGIYRNRPRDQKKGQVGPLLGGIGGDINSLLGDRADAFAGELEGYGSGGGGGGGGRGGGGGGGGGGGQVYQVDDPAQLRALTNVIAQELIGKALPEEQISQIVQKIQADELTAEQTSAGTVENVDPEARIAAMIRSFRPVESQAHDIVGMYDQFARMLGGPVEGQTANVNTRGF